MTSGGHLDDGRLSALLDGEAGSADAAHAAACARCAARAAAWREARRLVATSPAVLSPWQRDIAVAAALGAVPAAGDEQVPLAGAHPGARRRQRARRLVTPAAAAVLIGALVAGAVVAASHGGGSSSKSPAAGVHVAAPSAAGRSPSGTAAGPASPNGPNAGPVAGGPAGHAAGRPAALGSFSGTAPLVRALSSALGGAAATTTTPAVPGGSGPWAGLSCAYKAPSAAGVGLALWGATLDYDGMPAQVFVFTRDGRRLAVVLADAGCAVLARVSF